MKVLELISFKPTQNNFSSDCFGNIAALKQILSSGQLEVDLSIFVAFFPYN